MNKERLEIIKNKQMQMHILTSFDVDWLIERVQKLEEQKLALIEEMGQVDERFLESEHQNKKLREALEFYAEQDNYEWETTYRPQQEIDCMVIDDGGHTARKALESGNGDN